MASPQSDKRLNEIFAPLGIKDAAAKFHAKTGEIEKELAALGIAHKAAKPPFPPNPTSDPKAAPVAEAEVEMEDDMIEEDAEEETKEELLSEGGKIDLTRMMILLNGVLDMMGSTLDAAAASEMDRVSMFKTLDELKELRVSEKAAEKVTLDGLMEKLKSIEARQSEMEKKLSLTPRSAAQTQASSDPEIAKRIVSEAIDGAEKARKEGELIESAMFGKVLPPIKYN